MLVKYILQRDLVAVARDGTWATIPAGATVEVPAMILGTGTIKVLYKERLMTVLAKDFFDSAKIVPGNQN